MSKIAQLPSKTIADPMITGIIKESAENDWLVHLGGSAILAGTAFSCLVTPQVNDKVLLAHDGADYHIIAILERASTDKVSLKLGEEAVLTASDGDLAIQCRNKLLLNSQSAELQHESLSVVNQTTRLTSGDVSVVGEELHSRFKTVKRFAQLVIDVCDTATRKLTHCFKTVEGMEQHQSQNAIHSVANNLTLRSHHANITARKEMKIDGERIHMG